MWLQLWPRTRVEKGKPKCKHLAIEKSDHPCQAQHYSHLLMLLHHDLSFFPRSTWHYYSIFYTYQVWSTVNFTFKCFLTLPKRLLTFTVKQSSEILFYINVLTLYRCSQLQSSILEVNRKTSRNHLGTAKNSVELICAPKAQKFTVNFSKNVI